MMSKIIAPTFNHEHRQPSIIAIDQTTHDIQITMGYSFNRSALPNEERSIIKPVGIYNSYNADEADFRVYLFIYFSRIYCWCSNFEKKKKKNKKNLKKTGKANLRVTSVYGVSWL